MPTYLNLHPENSGTPQAKFRSHYELVHADYSLWRSTDRKGEISSNLRGGEINIAILGHADAVLFAWLFDPVSKEDGEIVITDIGEQVISKVKFQRARTTNFRMHYDSRAQNGLLTIVNLQAEMLSTDNDLYYENR